MQIVESTLRPRGLVRIKGETIQIVEAMIRRLAEFGWTFIKIINEKLEPRRGVALLKVIGETATIVESKLRVLVQGGTSSIIKVINEVVNVIEGPFQLITGLIKVIDETTQLVESRIRVLAGGLIKVINENVSLVESRIKIIGQPLLKIISDTVTLVEAVPIHTAIAIIAKKSYAAGVRAAKKYLWWLKRR